MDTSIDNLGNADASMGASAASGTIQVAADAVSVDGTPPDVGDKVTFTVEGTVKAVNGDQLTIMPDTVNGEALPVPQRQKTERDTLRDGAMASDAASS